MIDGWSLGWRFSNGESVTHQWNSDITTGPTGVVATSLAWNAQIASGGTVTFGFNGSIVSGEDPVVPDEFYLNGGSCQ